MSHPLTPLGHHFLFRFTLAVSLLAGCALGVSAATFAPTSEELASSANRSTEAPLNFSALEVQVDSTGRSSYLLDDRRYLVDAVAVDSALVGNLWPGGRVYYQF